MKGWMMPPVTGNYTFYIASDDHGEFWLSTDDSPKNMFLACTVPIATYSRAWTWFPHQRSSPIWLVAGQAIYYEVRLLLFHLWSLEFLCMLT